MYKRQHVNRYEKFEGSKDLCMSIGFCYLFIDKNPEFVPGEPELGPEVFSLARYRGAKTAGWSSF